MLLSCCKGVACFWCVQERARMWQRLLEGVVHKAIGSGGAVAWQRSNMTLSGWASATASSFRPAPSCAAPPVNISPLFCGYLARFGVTDLPDCPYQ
eukprot:4659709-Amphidinium_carterae.3